MRNPVIHRSRRAGFNMTPMIDVVFLLIIFFLVSSHLARQELRLELPLPVAQSGEDDPAVPAPRVTINVDAEGNVTVGGRAVAMHEIGEQLVTARRELGDTMEVRIRGSRLTEYGAVEPVMLACTRAGIWNVSYAVWRQEH